MAKKPWITQDQPRSSFPPIVIPRIEAMAVPYSMDTTNAKARPRWKTDCPGNRIVVVMFIIRNTSRCTNSLNARIFQKNLYGLHVLHGLLPAFIASSRLL